MYRERIISTPFLIGFISFNFRDRAAAKSEFLGDSTCQSIAEVSLALSKTDSLKDSFFFFFLHNLGVGR